MSENQLSSKIEKEVFDFITITMLNIAKYHKFDTDEKRNAFSPLICFISNDQYIEKIHEVAPNEDITDDGHNLGIGKAIYKNGKNYIFIRSGILEVLIKSGFKDIQCKFTLYHELGHCVEHILKTVPNPIKKPAHPVPLGEVSIAVFIVAINEYMANKHISFLLSEEDCIELLKNNSLFSDTDNAYNNISDKYDLFNRFWNGPNAILKNLIEHCPLYQKINNYNNIDSYKNNEILEYINPKWIISFLNKPEIEFRNLYDNLVYTFNSIVADYNSDNPPILQRPIQPLDTEYVNKIFRNEIQSFE
jgi:hypothetical protein